MKLRHLFIFTLILSTSAFGQIINNTFVEGPAVIVGQKTKAGASFTFSEGMGGLQYCYLPFKETKGFLELPRDKNGNLLPANCKHITEADKNIDINFKAQYQSKKFDGVMLFSQDQMGTLYQCLQDKEALTEYSQHNNWGYVVSDDEFSGASTDSDDKAPKMTDAELKEYTLKQTTDMCTTWLSRVHVLALKKKRKLNKSTKELITKHIENSDRVDQQKSDSAGFGSAPYVPSNTGLNMSLGFGL